MELLAASYASSEEEENDTPRLADAYTQPLIDIAPKTEDAIKADALAARRSRAQDEAARVAIANRFTVRAQTATHRMTTDARRFAYQPYPNKQLRRRAQETPPRAAPPLFSTLRALATPIDALNSTDAPDSASTRDSVILPVWQTHRRIEGHTGAINCLQWNPRYPPLFLSASMDHTIRVWLVPRDDYDNDDTPTSVNDSQSCQRVLRHHTRGVHSATWSIDGRHIWSGSFDGIVDFVDVERADVVHRYAHGTNELVSSVRPHPTDPQLALVGTDRGRILQRDLRMAPSSPPAASYCTKTTGEILDLLFLPSGDSNDFCFVSSNALTARETSHQTLRVWDVRSTALLNDHLHNDLCSFTRLCLHPNRTQFVAQSTRNETVLFSAQVPYKRLKSKWRFHAGHDVQGFRVGCSFNASGSLLASGDVHGRVVVYSGPTRRVLKQYHVYDRSMPCLAVAFHPQWTSTLLSGGYDGRIDFFDSMAP